METPSQFNLLAPCTSLEFVSAVSTRGNYNPITGVWAVGTVLVEGPQTLTITALVVGANTQTNTVSVADADQFDPNTANNTDTVNNVVKGGTGKPGKP